MARTVRRGCAGWAPGRERDCTPALVERGCSSGSRPGTATETPKVQRASETVPVDGAESGAYALGQLAACLADLFPEVVEPRYK